MNTISDAEAKRISAEWHGGGGTALYAFASTGTINTARADHDLYHEISDCIGQLQKQTAQGVIKMPAYKRDSRNLFALQDYITYHKARGPVPGWADLTR